MGTGFLFGKIAFREMTVAENVFFRFFFACLILVPILIVKWKPFASADLCWLFPAAVVGVPVQFVMQFKGLQLTTVSHASLIVGTLPVLIALSSTFFLHERLRKLEWGVLLLSPAGVLAIAFSAGHSTQATGPTVMGDVLVWLSMCAAAVSILISKHLMGNYDSLQITVWMLAIGAALLFVWNWVLRSRPISFLSQNLGGSGCSGTSGNCRRVSSLELGTGANPGIASRRLSEP